MSTQFTPSPSCSPTPEYDPRVSYSSLRKVKEKPATVYETRVQVQSVMNIPNDENVRDYLLDTPGRQRRRGTQVHRDIEDTLRNRPELFDLLNSGVTICTPHVVIDNDNKIVDIGCDASLINGAQTQGVISDLANEGVDLREANVRLEIIVSKDRDLIADISIARNSQNAVMPISIAGRKGIFDDLEASMRQAAAKLQERSDFSLRKSETDLGDYINTEHLLQVIAAVVPESIGREMGYGHMDAYSKKTKWIKLFAKLHELRCVDAASADLYNFHLDIAYHALKLYNHWKNNQAFKGCGLWCIERDGGVVVNVPDGIVFPIISAYSNFVVHEGGKWRFKIPSALSDKKLVDAACRAYQEIAGHNVNAMGKKAACYSAISAITEIYSELA